MNTVHNILHCSEMVKIVKQIITSSEFQSFLYYQVMNKLFIKDLGV